MLAQHVITGGADYESGPFSVTIRAGQIIASFSIPIIDDNIFEANKSFNLTIDQSSLSCGVLLQSVDCVVTVTIVDDDG